MRAIDADELKTAFPICDNSKPVLVACVRATINHMPTIEPERKNGKWKYIGFMTVECTECHAQLHELECTNYCPNCGADMRGEEDG